MGAADASGEPEADRNPAAEADTGATLRDAVAGVIRSERRMVLATLVRLTRDLEIA